MKSQHAVRLVLLQMLFFLFFHVPAFGAMHLSEKLAVAGAYEGSKIIQVMDSGATSMAMLEVKASRDDVIEFYKKKLQGLGWKVALQAEQEDGAVIHFTKDKMAIQVNAGQSEDGMLQYQLISMEE